MATGSDASQMRRANLGLDAVHFFLADVQAGLGPYLAIYLLTERHWDEASIGTVMAIATLAGIVAQTPAGAFIDSTRTKRVAIAAAALLVTVASVAIVSLQGFAAIAASQAFAHVAAAIFPPGLAALTLGIVGHHRFTARTGRNESFNHAGNAVAAIIAGGLAYFLGPTVVFYLLAVNSIASLVSVLLIPERAINHDLARGYHDELPSEGTASAQTHPAGALYLLGKYRPLLIFAACTVMFHLANAAMLPLVGQKLALKDANSGTSLMSACIVAAQLVMVPMAMLCGAKADIWGRRPLFIAGFSILLVRGMLYTLSDNSFWLVGVQLLDGVGAGIFGAIFPVIVADIMRGTGHFNAAIGVVGTAQGIGAALSTALAGVVVVHAGYSAAFLVLAAIAGGGLLLFALAMPETKPQAASERRPPAREARTSAPLRQAAE